MSEKKPRADALLKNLPVERQDEIWSRLTVKTAAWPDTSYKAVKKWLAEDGVSVSASALFEFFSWYPLRLQAREDEQTTDAIKKNLKEEVQNITEEELDAFGQKTFGLLAIRHKDLNGFVTVRSSRTKALLEREKIQIRKDKLKLDERHLSLLEKKAALADQTEKVLTDAELTPEQRAQRIKEIYGRA